MGDGAVVVVEDKLSLANLAKGAVIERFDVVMQEVLGNIQDINTDAEFIREINVKVKIKPSPERDMMMMITQVVPKLAPLSSLLARAFVSKDVKGRGEAHEIHAPTQQDLPQNVTDINEHIEQEAT